MEAGVTVRERRDDDATALVALLAETHERDGYPVRASRVAWSWLADGVQDAWVAVLDGQVVGHVCLVPERDGLFLARFFVAVAARRSGAGAALLDTVEGWADRHGRDLRLDVLDHNVAARRLYARRGWQHVGSVPAAWLGGAGPWPLAHDYRRPAR